MDDRQHPTPRPDMIVVPGFVIDLASEQLRTEDGTVCPLRPQAFAVLKYLAQHAGCLATKTELHAAVWHDMVVTDDSLVQAIREIRRALNDKEHHLIKTVHRRGYILLPEARVLSEVAEPQPAVSNALAGPPSPAERATRNFVSRSAGRMIGLILAMLTAAAIIAVLHWNMFQ